MTSDPYDVSPDEVKRFKSENLGGDEGILCPKRNTTMEGDCYACKTVQQLFNTGDKGDNQIALDKMAKKNYYMNVVFPENKDKSVLMMIGKKVGDQILSGMELKGWTDIVNPKAGKGREMTILKSKGDLGFNSYSADPVLSQADWDIPKKVLDALPNISDDIVGVLASTDPGDIFKISSIKIDEALNFRICPWRADANNKWPVAVVFRHWGVTQDEIDGVVPLDLTTVEDRKKQKDGDETVAPWEKNDEAQTHKGEVVSEEEIKRDESPSTEIPCKGEPNFYEMEDPECIKCTVFKSCGREVLAKTKK